MAYEKLRGNDGLYSRRNTCAWPACNTKIASSSLIRMHRQALLAGSGKKPRTVRHEEPKRSCRWRVIGWDWIGCRLLKIWVETSALESAEKDRGKDERTTDGQSPSQSTDSLGAAQTSTRPFEAYSSILAKSDPEPVFRGGRSISVEGGARSGHLMRPGDRRVHQNWSKMKLAFNSPHFPRVWCLLLPLGLGKRKVAHGWAPGGELCCSPDHPGNRLAHRRDPSIYPLSFWHRRRQKYPRHGCRITNQAIVMSSELAASPVAYACVGFEVGMSQPLSSLAKTLMLQDYSIEKFRLS